MKEDNGGTQREEGGGRGKVKTVSAFFYFARQRVPSGTLLKLKPGAEGCRKL